MGVRTGNQYIEGLRDDRRIYINGDRVRDVTNYPPLQRVIRELAALYDRQNERNFRDVLTYRSPNSGEPVSTSFLIPTALEEVERRVRGERARAELTNGMMGRLPDYMNAYATDLAAIRDLLSRHERAFGDNTWKYYELCREKDLALTHTLVDPQIDRSKGIEAPGRASDRQGDQRRAHSYRSTHALDSRANQRRDSGRALYATAAKRSAVCNGVCSACSN